MENPLSMNMEQEKYYKLLNEEMERKRLEEIRQRQRMIEDLQKHDRNKIIKFVVWCAFIGLLWWFMTANGCLDQFTTRNSILTPQMRAIVESPKEGYVIDSQTGELRPMNSIEYGFKIGFDGATRE